MSKSKLAKLERSYEIIVQLNKLKQSTVFSIEDKHVHSLLTIVIAYVPCIFNPTAVLFIPCILDAYFTQIGYRCSPIDMGYVTHYQT